MSNQFERVQKRQQEEKQKEIQKKIDQLVIYLNLAIIKYERTLEVYLDRTPNGSIVGKRKVVKTHQTGLAQSHRFLQQQSVLPQPYKWTLFPSKEFIKEIEKREKELGLNIVPGLRVSQFGIVPNVIFAEPVQKPLLPETNPVDAPESHSTPVDTNN